MRTLPATSITTPATQFPGPQSAQVVRLVGDRLYVKLDAAPGLEVEVSWSRPHPPHTHTVIDNIEGGSNVTRTTAQLTYTAPDPPAGTRCLVLFTDRGVADGWVVAWKSWPA